MIELTNRDYSRVEQQEEGDLEDDEAMENNLPSQNTTEPPAEEEERSLPVESSPTSAAGPTTAIDRLFVNIFLLCFLLSLAFAFGGVTPRVPFLSSSSEHDEAPTPTTLHHNHAPGDELSEYAHRYPTADRAHKHTNSPVRVFETCRPPSSSDTNRTILSQVHVNRHVIHKRDLGVLYLSEDASIMILTFPSHPSNRCSIHCQNGQVRTYGWACDTQTYEELGEKLLDPIDTQARFGSSAKLSADGRVLVVQSIYRVSVFRWQQGTWRPCMEPVPVGLNQQGKLPAFSLSEDGTTLAVISASSRRGLTVLVCHDGGEPHQWHRSTYHSHGAFLDKWNHDISIALTDDPTTISLSSANLGWIIRASLIDGKIVPKIDTRLELFPVEVFDQDVRAEWIRRTTVFGDSILYHHGLPFGASNSSVSMAEYRGGEWVKKIQRQSA